MRSISAGLIVSLSDHFSICFLVRTMWCFLGYSPMGIHDENIIALVIGFAWYDLQVESRVVFMLCCENMTFAFERISTYTLTPQLTSPPGSGTEI